MPVSEDFAMKNLRFLLGVALLGLCAATTVQADEANETRMRDQLRQTMLELRQLQDQNSELQVKLSGAQSAPVAVAKPAPSPKTSRAELDKVRAEMRQAMTDAVAKVQADLDTSKAQLATLQQQLADATAQLNARNTATREAEKRLAGSNLRADSCEKDNKSLVNISGQLLQRYHDMSVWQALWQSEPLTGLGHVQREQLVEKYRNGIIDASIGNSAEPASAAPGLAEAPAADRNGRITMMVDGHLRSCRKNGERLVCDAVAQR
jgi:uncharacterized phage infection (PIP) family protein YhgE